MTQRFHLLRRRSNLPAYAGHLARVEREACEALARSKSAEWLTRQQALRETEWEMHEKCIAASRKALDKFIEKDKVFATLADIARMLEVASKLGRMATGMPTDKTEVTGEDGGPIKVELEVALKKIYGDANEPPRRGDAEKIVEAEVVGETPTTAREVVAPRAIALPGEEDES